MKFQFIDIIDFFISIMSCKGICEKYKIKKPNFGTNGRYQLGHKRCTTCETFVSWNGKHCPCCNFTLRTKPRNTQGRHKMQERLMIERI